jgi:AcrR family transcriptional regulator
MDEQRQSRESWIRAALEVLGEHGHEALKAERLARRLNVSRGSFYWHFADVRAFQQAVLEAWEIEAVEGALGKAAPPPGSEKGGKLRGLIALAFAIPVELERAMHRWAGSSPDAAASVERVNARRLAALRSMLIETGHSPARATTKAKTLYWSYLGRILLGDGEVDEAAIAELQGWFSAAAAPGRDGCTD